MAPYLILKRERRDVGGNRSTEHETSQRGNLVDAERGSLFCWSRPDGCLMQGPKVMKSRVRAVLSCWALSRRNVREKSGKDLPVLIHIFKTEKKKTRTQT